MFHLLFKRTPEPGQFCNSKWIRVYPNQKAAGIRRRNLVIIRCGARHSLIDDGVNRNFDIALNLYAKPSSAVLGCFEYLYAGGINKFMAAEQFLTDDLLENYEGFMFLDDDLEITYSGLNGFLEYCGAHDLGLAQPSLSRDSYTSHAHLVNKADCGQRVVNMVEVMCPFFAQDTLRTAIRTFSLSYSTWGLDAIWPRMLRRNPVVVDEFAIRHLKPMDRGSAFYNYMKRIGVSPKRELVTLRGMSSEALGRLTASTS
jgi:hypothetical protein